ncbi:MAG: KUP/HAK/KT family potassium transporter [Candidatus Delongbacteria bacterium]
MNNQQHQKGLIGLCLTAIGVVFGDIGTSPLYTIKESLGEHYRLSHDPVTIFGVMSLVFWAMTIVVVVKYLGYILRADNHGEGGIMSLLALVLTADNGKRIRALGLVSALAIVGTSLLLSDGVITPAITVLSAVEGLEVALPRLGAAVLPISLLILVGLFLVQKFGTDRIGRVFGPVMLLWFFTIGTLGLGGILQHPEILGAVNPLHMVRFFGQYGWHGVLVLGSVVLCITGGEALYADMGHFGRRPIRLSWAFLVMPCLLLSYFGQCASVLVDPTGVANPFYSLSPAWFTLPLLLISTSAAIIASQSLITGSFSLAQQAMQLGYLPRVQVQHTSHSVHGQIYVPVVNYLLMAACLACVLFFRSSTNLAAAYGIAVMGTMTITTCLFFAVTVAVWNWPLWRALLICGGFLLIDLVFTAGNVVKIAHGGWYPLAMGAVLFAVMTTWKKGSRELNRRVRQSLLPLEYFVRDIAHSQNAPLRVPGVAVFLTQNSGTVPRIMLHHLKHTKVLHETVIVLSVLVERQPVVDREGRVNARALGEGFYQVDVHQGYMENIYVPAILKGLGEPRVNLNQVSYYMGHITLIDSGRTHLARWQRLLFIFLSRNARSARTFFGIPPGRVVELGLQDEI